MLSRHLAEGYVGASGRGQVFDVVRRDEGDIAEPAAVGALVDAVSVFSVASPG